MRVPQADRAIKVIVAARGANSARLEGPTPSLVHACVLKTVSVSVAGDAVAHLVHLNFPPFEPSAHSSTAPRRRLHTSHTIFWFLMVHRLRWVGSSKRHSASGTGSDGCISAQSTWRPGCVRCIPHGSRDMVSAQAMFLSLANVPAALFYGVKHAHLHHHKRLDQTRKVPWS
jgi:hypothetical protein